MIGHLPADGRDAVLALLARNCALKPKMLVLDLKLQLSLAACRRVQLNGVHTPHQSLRRMQTSSHGRAAAVLAPKDSLKMAIRRGIGDIETRKLRERKFSECTLFQFAPFCAFLRLIAGICALFAPTQFSLKSAETPLVAQRQHTAAVRMRTWPKTVFAN